ncbi:MAG TPA: hypothetical protein VHU40_06455, partial [Polyangia bacterium]|nr:hypothetical protein [Polyangia bacterium]
MNPVEPNPATKELIMDLTHNANATVHRGSCHCGAIRFEVTVDLSGGVTRCNCTVCTKLGTLGI